MMVKDLAGDQIYHLNRAYCSKDPVGSKSDGELNKKPRKPE